MSAFNWFGLYFLALFVAWACLHSWVMWERIKARKILADYMLERARLDFEETRAALLPYYEMGKRFT